MESPLALFLEAAFEAPGPENRSAVWSLRLLLSAAPSMASRSRAVIRPLQARMVRCRRARPLLARQRRARMWEGARGAGVPGGRAECCSPYGCPNRLSQVTTATTWTGCRGGVAVCCNVRKTAQIRDGRDL